MVEVVLPQQGRGQGRSSRQVKSEFVWFRGISVYLGNRCCDHRCARSTPPREQCGGSTWGVLHISGAAGWFLLLGCCSSGHAIHLVLFQFQKNRAFFNWARATDFQGIDWWVCLDMQVGRLMWGLAQMGHAS